MNVKVSVEGKCIINGYSYSASRKSVLITQSITSIRYKETINYILMQGPG